YPATEKHPVTDTYHGTQVTDDYLWLADFGDPKVKAWVDEQNAFTQSVLQKIPYRAAVAERLKELYNDVSVSYSRVTWQGKLFAIKNQPPKNQPMLVVVDSPDDISTEKIVVDPNAIAPDGSLAIDFYVPSLDGKLVAVSLSRGGSEDGSVHVFETATGKELGDVVPRVNYPTGGGSVAWNAMKSGFYYTRYPQGNERPAADRYFYQQVYFHRLGTPASHDTYVIGKEFPPIAEIRLSTTNDGRFVLATVANGDGGEFAHLLMNPGGKWKEIAGFGDGVKSAKFGAEGRLYLRSVKDAPKGKILALPLSNPVLARATVVVPESDVSIADFLPTAGRLYVADIDGGPYRVRVFDLKGEFQNLLSLPPLASVRGLIALKGDEILYAVETFLEPLAYYRHNPLANATSRSRLAGSSHVRYDDCEVVRESAVSKDGTKVPMFVFRKKGTVLDGNNPVLLYGYGGYGISESPWFTPRLRIWFDQGGVFVVGNLRGGAEFGEAWHEAGKLTKKQNVFDDFAACAKYLIDAKYTNPSRLAIEGGSNGGLLMGAVLTQHPELLRAVVSHVGIYDMLKVELFPNGAFNVTEFGTVKDKAQFDALYAYSPYHHVVNGAKYPAILMMTGDNDGRVDPANSRKMVARLQEATASELPILLRTSAASGHGIGTGLSERVLQETDVFAFLFDQLKMNFQTHRH
ncbi:MAG: prolyl oligopeptidase family serine peptidase, partial [Bacteroidota bacterium]